VATYAAAYASGIDGCLNCQQMTKIIPWRQCSKKTIRDSIEYRLDVTGSPLGAPTVWEISPSMQFLGQRGEFSHQTLSELIKHQATPSESPPTSQSRFPTSQYLLLALSSPSYQPRSLLRSS